MKSYRADAARREMRDILTAVERGEHIEIKRYDTPTAIVVPVEWYEQAKALTNRRPPGVSRSDASTPDDEDGGWGWQ